MIIGHRGVKGSILENTLESILHSIDLGVDGIEIDIQRCYTGEIVLFHDENLNRLAFKDQFYFGKTVNVPINELQWYHLYNTELIDSMGKKYKIPKLIDVLTHPKVYMSDILINIEIKDYRSHELVADMIFELIEEGLYEPGRFLISSCIMDHLIYLEELKTSFLTKDKNYQNFKIGWNIGQGKLSEKDVLISINKHLEVLTHVILDKNIVNSELIGKIKELGLQIIVYTINDQSDYPLDDIHNIVEGIITDKPKNFIPKN
jgi:glycerophosphoryl diester phosphodiesterase